MAPGFEQQVHRVVAADRHARGCLEVGETHAAAPAHLAHGAARRELRREAVAVVLGLELLWRGGQTPRLGDCRVVGGRHLRRGSSAVLTRMSRSSRNVPRRTYSRPSRIFSGRISSVYALSGSAWPARISPSLWKRSDAQSVMPGRTLRISRSSSV